MPLLKPDIQEALRSVGMAQEKDASLNERLDATGLSLDETLRILSDVAYGADKPVEKLRAIETALKLRGVLKDQAAPPPSITIVINDPAAAGTVNPVLLPRQLNTNKETVN